MDEGSKKSSKEDLFHVIHKVPAGDSPYVRAKYAQRSHNIVLDEIKESYLLLENQTQLVERDAKNAIMLFWEAIHAGDRVDSALKDMAVVMKQIHRPNEAIEAIKSFRLLCSKHSQDSLDNILIDLFKKCGRIDEQIELLKRKLRMIYQGEAFHGKPTKTARSHGKKFQISVKQEISRLLGNLGWAYMQKPNYMMAEAVYKKAQMIDPDAHKACNLGLCLIKQGRFTEAISVLEEVWEGRLPGSDDYKARKRAADFLMDIRSKQFLPDSVELLGLHLDAEFLNGLELLISERGPLRSKRLPIFEEISPFI